jgi:glycosyltransferase involved in cell wall biosynthesis
MRILHVTDSYLPTIGGIEFHVRDLSAHQRATGHQVAIATPRASGPGHGGVGVLHPVGRGWLEDADPDVVHAHVSIVSPFALRAARRSARLGIPTLVTVHSLWTHVGPLPGLARDLWGMRRWDVTWSAVSSQAAGPVRDLLGRPVHVLPNAVDLGAWSPPRAVAAPGPPRVLSVMRLTGVKRTLPLARILRHAAERADFTATVVGDGPERAALERYLRRHRLSERVRTTGSLDREEIRHLLRGASVFVAPAHRESFGLAALEARASGVPVVASSRSGVSTFIEHGVDGLLAADDEGLAAQLVTLLRDRPVRERIARHNRLERPAYGWDHALERTSALYATAARDVPLRATGRLAVQGAAG